MRLKFVICAAALGLVANAVTMAQKPVKFTSVYSSLNKGCKTLRGGPGTDDASLCRGPAGYEVEVYFSAATMQINAEKRGSDKSAGLATLDLTFDDRRTTLEWRLANGKPFAVIMRVPIYAEPAPGEYFGKVIGQQLKVTGLVGYDIDESIDATTPHANQKAREAADKAYKKP